MAHGAGANASTTPPVTQTLLAGLTPAILPQVEEPAAIAFATPLIDASSKRPHDPPHLHPVALLI
jgi:hypothetical protein